MNRRRPVTDVAVVPLAPGEDATLAVLRKVAGQAVAALSAQLREHEPACTALSAFFAGYLAGHARHQALKHGVNAEAQDGALFEELRRALLAAAPGPLEPAVAALRVNRRTGAGTSPRARLRAEPVLADAGYLVGHLEAVCGTRKLVRQALGLLRGGQTVPEFLTACDVAADPVQTRQPTLSLRFDPMERAVIEEAFGQLRQDC